MSYVGETPEQPGWNMDTWKVYQRPAISSARLTDQGTFGHTEFGKDTPGLKSSREQPGLLY